MIVVCMQDKDLRAAAKLVQDALNAPTVEQEEALWYVHELSNCVLQILQKTETYTISFQYSTCP